MEPLCCRTNVILAMVLLAAVLLVGCGPALTPFEASPYPSGPIAQMKQRCIDEGNVWEDDRLQCRQVAPWKRSR